MIIVEPKFYPFLMMSFRGSNHSEAEHRAMLDTTLEVGRKALRDKTKHLSITVGGASMSAAERKMVARLMEGFPKDVLGTLIGSLVIVDNPVVRGALTALRWLSPQLRLLEAVPSVEAAMSAAAETFAKHDITPENAQVVGARYWLKAELERNRQQRLVGT